ncbi:MAG: hypothetical protein ABIF88_04110 [archaeon]
MLFKKKKGMIDVRELQKRGVVRIPSKDMVIPTNSQGFIELTGKSRDSSANSIPSPKSSTKSDSDFFNFIDSPATSTNSFSTESDGYNKRQVDEKIVDLDNKIYKLEQRVELLEKKVGVNTNEDTSIGVMGW